ncbi:MAG: DUF3616 domain-containing protein [Alphaproteobacteria bacterium]|nr:DUF3616 domain-containing protein [Alphaproteobacteria bacterium]
MSEGFLIGRVDLQFDVDHQPNTDVRDDLSAVALDKSGHLWVASDELAGIERLRPAGAGVFKNHRHFDLTGVFDLPEPNAQEEIDIEGMEVVGETLWLTGSHTSTRKKPKGESDSEDLKRLAKVTRKPNRYLVGRVSVAGGELNGKAAHLPYNKHGNALTKALRDDPHLGPFVHIPRNGEKSIQLASKENGFDIEGLAARGDRVLLGLRGPVLRGWAALFLEIEPKANGNGTLELKEIGSKGRPYIKHFVFLDGMGVRDLCWRGDDLLILAGPTMDLTGTQTVWRLRNAGELGDDSITEREDTNRLQRLFDLPIVRGADKAEGIALYDGLGEPGIMILYDAPSKARKPDDKTLVGDVFRLPAA